MNEMVEQGQMDNPNRDKRPSVRGAYGLTTSFTDMTYRDFKDQAGEWNSRSKEK